MVKAMLKEAFGPVVSPPPKRPGWAARPFDLTTRMLHRWINDCARRTPYRPFDFDEWRRTRSAEHINLIGDLLIAMLVGTDEVDRWIKRYEAVVFRYRAIKAHGATE